MHPQREEWIEEKRKTLHDQLMSLEACLALYEAQSIDAQSMDVADAEILRRVTLRVTNSADDLVFQLQTATREAATDEG